ncbi:cyclin- protein [Cymbomonas tetramitiformis]|uniref:Cyclin- protein n=1 Tax=Cymbomonas tetramitiformis TaxID=36881 RepID=A0AAE0CGY1_9CHLO|nr:cyclin- protein [Cymbomonas tetramitiformis]
MATEVDPGCLECNESLDSNEPSGVREDLSLRLKELGLEEFDCAWRRMLTEPSQEEILTNMLHAEGKAHTLPDPDYTWRVQYPSFAVDREILLEETLRVEENLGLSPATTALGINIFDRFCSNFQLPKDENWVTALAMRTSLFIASKIEEQEVPMPHEFQDHSDGERISFPLHYCRRMEIVILEHLEWRASAVTAVSFLDRLLLLLSPASGDAVKILYINSLCAIRQSFLDVEFLQYRPSCIAAAAIMSLLVFDSDTCCALKWEPSALETKLDQAIGFQASFRRCQRWMLKKLQQQASEMPLGESASRATSPSAASIFSEPAEELPELCTVGKPSVVVGAKRPRPQHQVTSKVLLLCEETVAKICLNAPQFSRKLLYDCKAAIGLVDCSVLIVFPGVAMPK